MFSFDLSFPTRIVFGKGKLSDIAKEAKALGTKALLATGGKSAKSTGLLDRVRNLLEQDGVSYVLFDSIEPNPRTDTVDNGAKLAREEGCDMVIALGGGSVMDAAKAIAAAAQSGRPIYDYMRGNPAGHAAELLPVQHALPVLAVPTVAATGSEANNISVLTHWETHEKSSISGPGMYPKVAILDPSLTYTVPPRVTAEACADIFAHLYESYLISPEGRHVQDGITESLIRQVVRFAKVAMQEPDNEEARSTLMWTSTLAISPFTREGRGVAFPLHKLEHTLSGFYDIAHGRGLAILSLPYFRQVILEDRPERLARMGRECFGVSVNDDRMAAEATIEAVMAWYKELGLTERLRDLGIPREALRIMAEDTIRVNGRENGCVESSRPLFAADVLAIYEACY